MALFPTTRHRLCGLTLPAAGCSTSLLCGAATASSTCVKSAGVRQDEAGNAQGTAFKIKATKNTNLGR